MGLEDRIAEWEAEGLNIVVITGMLTNVGGTGTPTVEDARKWKNRWEHTKSYTVADPTFSMVSGSQVYTPQATFINPRTFEVTYVGSGQAPYNLLLNMARANAGL